MSQNRICFYINTTNAPSHKHCTQYSTYIATACTLCHRTCQYTHFQSTTSVFGGDLVCTNTTYKVFVTTAFTISELHNDKHVSLKGKLISSYILAILNVRFLSTTHTVSDRKPPQKSPLAFFKFTCFQPAKLSYSSLFISKAFCKWKQKTERHAVHQEEDGINMTQFMLKFKHCFSIVGILLNVKQT